MDGCRRSVPASAIVDALMGASCDTKVMISIFDQHFHDNRKKLPIFPKESLASNFLDALWEWPRSGIGSMILQVARAMQVQTLCKTSSARRLHGERLKKTSPSGPVQPDYPPGASSWQWEARSQPLWDCPADSYVEALFQKLKIAINDSQWSQVNSMRCANIEDSHDKDSQS